MSLLLVRPAVAVLLLMSLAIGAAQAGGGQHLVQLLLPALAVIGFLLCSVALNDLADEQIDRVNLPRAPERTLVSGSGSRRRLAVAAGVAATIALLAATVAGWRSLVVVALGLGLSAAYSLPPTRLSARGAVASLVLPAGFVAVPFVLGALAVGGSVDGRALALLAALYLGFVGRILLKDFRDLRGDLLFGKRTFLVRHGRVVTCRASATLWAASTAVLVAVLPEPSWWTVVALVGCAAAAVAALRVLEVDAGPYRDERLVSAAAIAGRGSMLVVLGHLSMVSAGWPAWAQAAFVTALLAVTLGQAREMVVRGPRLVPWREPARDLAARDAAR